LKTKLKNQHCHPEAQPKNLLFAFLSVISTGNLFFPSPSRRGALLQGEMKFT
jgi:hypothetical protein